MTRRIQPTPTDELETVTLRLPAPSVRVVCEVPRGQHRADLGIPAGVRPAALASSRDAPVFTTALSATADRSSSLVARSVPDASRTETHPTDPALQDKAGPTPACRSVPTPRGPKHLSEVSRVYGKDERSLPESTEVRTDFPSKTLVKRSSVVSVRLRDAVKSALDSYASAQRITRSEALGRCISLGLERLSSVPSRPEDVRDALQSFAKDRQVFFCVGGTCTLGILRLLARWAAEIGGLKVPEEDLLDEVWSVGAGEWEQLVEEAETAGDGCSGTPKDRPEQASPYTETTERMPKTDVRFDLTLLRRVDAFATAEGVTRSRAIRELTGMGLDMVESQKVPMGRVEEILEAIESEKRLMAPLGAATLGTLRLLAHWASQTGASGYLKTSCSPRSGPSGRRSGSRSRPRPRGGCRKPPPKERASVLRRDQLRPERPEEPRSYRLHLAS